MLYQYFPGVSIPFARSNLQQIANTEESYQRNILQAIADVGGFCASEITEADIEKVKANISSLPESIRPLIEQVKPGPTISAQEEIMELLTDDQIRAFLLHEEGHLVLGHLDRNTPNVEYHELAGGGKVISNLQHELDADAYAAERVGKEVMRSALQEMGFIVAFFMHDIVPRKLGLEPKHSREEIINRLANDEWIKTRIEALS